MTIYNISKYCIELYNRCFYRAQIILSTWTEINFVYAYKLYTMFCYLRVNESKNVCMWMGLNVYCGVSSKTPTVLVVNIMRPHAVCHFYTFTHFCVSWLFMSLSVIFFSVYSFTSVVDIVSSSMGDIRIIIGSSNVINTPFRSSEPKRTEHERKTMKKDP